MLDFLNESVSLINGVLFISVFIFVILVYFFIKRKTKIAKQKNETLTPTASIVIDKRKYVKDLLNLIEDFNEKDLKKLLQSALELKHSSLDEPIEYCEEEIKTRLEEPIVNKKTGISTESNLMDFLFRKGKVPKKTIMNYCKEKLGLSEKDANILLKKLNNEGQIYDSGKGTIKSLE